MIVTTDNFLGPEGVATEDRLAENATTLVREGANDLAMQLRVKDAGERYTTGRIKYSCLRFSAGDRVFHAMHRTEGMRRQVLSALTAQI